MVLLNKTFIFCLSVIQLIVLSYAHTLNNHDRLELFEFDSSNIRVERGVGKQAQNNNANVAGALVTPCANQNEFLRSNLVKNNATRKDFCYNANKRTKRQVQDSGHAKFECIRDDLRAGVTDPGRPFQHPVPMKQYHNRDFPFQEVILRRDKDKNGNPINVPVYLRATILKTHTGQRRPPIGKPIKDYLDSVCAIEGQIARDPNADQAGHLLAHTLGGTTDDKFNFAPQVARLNTQTEGHHSVWWGEEREMVDFVSAVDGRRIEWELLVLYSPLQSPHRLRLRPTSFCLRHLNYNEHGHLVDNHNVRINQPEHVLCFSNDMPEDGCIVEQLSK